LAQQDLELARRVGAPWVVGRSLRILAEVQQGDAAVRAAREAVELLEGTSARLELAKARAVLEQRTARALDETRAAR
jgi:hypothetical protein